MRISLYSLIAYLFLIVPVNAQKFKVLESNSDFIKIEVNFENAYQIADTLIEGKSFQLIKGADFAIRQPGEPWLPDYSINVGVSYSANPELVINKTETQILNNKFIVPFPEEDPEIGTFKISDLKKEIYSQSKFFPGDIVIISSDYIMRYARIINISVSPYQFNPVTRELRFNKRISLTVNFNNRYSEGIISKKINDKFTDDFLKTTVVNYDHAVNWIGQLVSLNKAASVNHWYNPNKNYYKIYLKEKDVYRITYEYLEAANIPVQNLDVSKLQLFNSGEEVPLYVNDINGNNLFDQGEYFEFVGFPPQPSPYSALNIYNLENVYWFSYEADSSGKRYIPKDGYPNSWINSYDTTPYTIHFEKDSLYERLGHADNDQRDYWYWGKSSGNDGTLTSFFSVPFSSPVNIQSDASSIKIRVNMHGMTFNNCLDPDHKVKVFLTSQLIGEFTWDGPKAATFETDVDLSQIGIFESNNFQVGAYGDIPDDPCNPGSPRSDEIRVNWFEIEYPRTHSAFINHFTFESPPDSRDLTRFNVYKWERDNMKIFVPQRGEMIVNEFITHDEYNSVLFVDSLFERTEYFCVAEDYFLTPDSIVKDNFASDLRNLSNGSDYIIITHPNFRTTAERLADFRSSDFPDVNIISPRISVVDIQDVYDEFSNGLMDPYAIQSFIKYAFENWQAPSPSYIVLLGDMSYDYRHLIPSNRPNFIPAIPYHAETYGQAASDNMFVAVAGSDVVPDLAIGRLSCETPEEADILVDKIMNYPEDNSKKWKQNVLLISSGLSERDEALQGFNDANLLLDSIYLKPKGISSDKIFRYPNKPSHIPFQGEGLEIRKGFNEGAAIASYYGHGGGYQWDLVFNNDDIYQLSNDGRLPWILSVTCYTAHFDNQDVFGEQFNKIPDKGSIAFWGSSGLTFFSVGRSVNEKAFNEIFNLNNYIIGKIALAAKAKLSSPEHPIVAGQIALLTLLGDPVLKLTIPDKPDFKITASDITIEPLTPSVGDTIKVKVKIFNFGTVFPGDSVTVQLFVNSPDSSYYLNDLRLQSFGESDSATFIWIPDKGGLYNLTARINETEPIPEVDYTDNEATALFPVYDLVEPSIINPINGFVSTKPEVEFLFADIGNLLSMNLRYFIEIDTTLDFINPVIKSSPIQPSGGTLMWVSPSLPEGHYFWRTRIYNGQDSSRWSAIRALTVDNVNQNQGYFISDKHLKLFETNNVNFSESLKSLTLNLNPLPPRPSSDKFIEEIEVALPSDISGLSAFTTDGTYLYFGQIAFYGGPTKIYKMGTGYNGTIKGQLYGEIPNLEVPVWHQIFYYPDGYLYVATRNAHSLLKVDPQTGDTSRVFIPDGLLNSIDAQVTDDAFYISTDGNFVYNVAYLNEQGDFKYTIRILDPKNNWQKVQEDIIPTGQSYPYFTGFFVADGYFYPYENYWGGDIRRINLQTGNYEEEWLSFVPYQGFYAWAYDWSNDVVYASVFKDGYQPKFFKFTGKYLDAFGSVTSNAVGPASSWNSLKYEIDVTGSSGNYSTYLEGLNKTTRNWDTLLINLPDELDISSISADTYSYLKFQVNVMDSSYGLSEPVKIKSLNIDYVTPPEIIITRENISFSPDTVLQGFDVEVTVKISNYGIVDAENLKVDYLLSSIDFPSGDSLYLTRNISVPKLDSVISKDTIHTTSNIFNNLIRVVITNPKTEFFTFNNIAGNSFYVARDSINPFFRITFDGQEIISGDIVSSKPEVLISLKDNSPLPIDTSFFTLVYNNFPLYFSNPDLEYSYTSYPNSEALVKWKPELQDGKHILEVLAKDASGNFFDTTSYRIIFYVYNDADLREVLNYPNPFKNDTYFTFELRGVKVPDEFLIKIYTVAGRLIREIPVPPAALQIGFNRIYWNGRDQDGDEIANGLYFYKVIARNGDVVKMEIKKMAKIK
jgi:hypothetical protein